MSLGRTIDEVYNKFGTQPFLNFPDLKEGRYFVFTLQKDLQRTNDLLQRYGFSKDKKGWLCENPFPLTIEITNRELAPGDIVYVGQGQKQICVVYYGICPELENFVTITLWPKQSATSKLAYERIYSIVKEDKENKQVLKFQGGYGLRVPNELHPFRDGNVKSSEKTKCVYDWMYAPYIKEIGNNLLSHRSPVSFRKIFFMNEESKRVQAYCNIKTTVGCVKGLRKDEIKVEVPSFQSKNILFIGKLCPDLFETLKKSVPTSPYYYFQIFEIAGSNIERYVKAIFPAESIDVLASLISYLLYLSYLGKKRLQLCPIQAYTKIFQLCSKAAITFCKDYFAGETFLTSQNLFMGYLSPFFRIIENNVYYVPFFLNQETDEVIQLFDRSLAQNKTSLLDAGLLFDKKGKIMDSKRLQSAYRILRFLIDAKALLYFGNEQKLTYSMLEKQINTTY